MKNNQSKEKEGAPFPSFDQSAEQLICPHCEKIIERIEWRNFGEGKIGLVGCSNCKKVLGANVVPIL